MTPNGCSELVRLLKRDFSSAIFSAAAHRGKRGAFANLTQQASLHQHERCTVRDLLGCSSRWCALCYLRAIVVISFIAFVKQLMVSAAHAS